MALHVALSSAPLWKQGQSSRAAGRELGESVFPHGAHGTADECAQHRPQLAEQILVEVTGTGALSEASLVSQPNWPKLRRAGTAVQPEK
jgi:hypothetical protein